MAREQLVVHVPEFAPEIHPTDRDIEDAAQEIVAGLKDRKAKFGKTTFDPEGWGPGGGNALFIEPELTPEDHREFWEEAEDRGLVDGFVFFRYRRLQGLFNEMYPEFEGVFKVTPDGIVVDPALPEMNVVDVGFYEIPWDAQTGALVLPKKIVVPKKNEGSLNLKDALRKARIEDGYLVAVDMLY